MRCKNLRIRRHIEASGRVCHPVGLIEFWTAPKEDSLALQLVIFGRQKTGFGNLSMSLRTAKYGEELGDLQVHHNRMKCRHHCPCIS